jgi:hypothetical protein
MYEKKSETRLVETKIIPQREEVTEYNIPELQNEKAILEARVIRINEILAEYDKADFTAEVKAEMAAKAEALALAVEPIEEVEGK